MQWQETECENQHTIESSWHTRSPRYAAPIWIGLCSVLRLHQHSIGYMEDGFYRSKDPTNCT